MRNGVSIGNKSLALIGESECSTNKLEIYGYSTLEDETGLNLALMF